MRTIIVLFLFITIAGKNVFSQASHKKVASSNRANPTQNEIEAQKQEAIREAKQQVADLKKDIAEAKAGGEDPESIKEMEKQLTTLENMVAMLEKTNLSGRPRSETQAPVKIAEPKYVSPFTPIVLKQKVSMPTEKEATDQIFWYRGKKIDANTLITTSGTVVRYDRKNKRIIYEPGHNPGPDTSYYGLLLTLKQTQQIKNSFVKDAIGFMNGFFMYPEIQAAYDEFDLIKDRFYGKAINTFDIPQVNSPFWPLDIKKMILDLDKYCKNLPGKKIVLPPKRPVGECLCEVPDEVVQWDKDLRKWLMNFFSEEIAILDELLAIFNQIEHAPGPNPYKVYDLNYELYLSIALTRANFKLEDLLNEYSGDLQNILFEDALVYAKRTIEHWIEKYDLKRVIGNVQGGVYQQSLSLFEQVKDAVFSSKFEDYILFRKKDKEFNIVFDHQLYISHEYNKKILSPGYKVNDNIKKWLEGLEDYNRFTLTVKTEFEYAPKTDDRAQIWNVNGEFQSQNIIVSLGVEDCYFNLRITDANYRDRNGDEEKLKIPLAVIKGSKQYGRGSAIPYTGPPNAMMLFPRFKLSFCGDESEVKVDLLSYTQADIDKHRGDDPREVFTTDMLAYANKMFLGYVKTQSNVNDLINTAGKMMDMNNTAIAQSTGNRDLDEMKMDYGMNLKRYELLYHLAASTHTEKTIIKLGKLSPQKSPILGPNPTDLVDKFDADMVLKMTYAYITLELTHTPK